MHAFLSTLYLCIPATLIAIAEIEAEGGNGWAQKFPTYYRTETKFAKVWDMFQHRPVTGYHMAMFLVPLSFFMYPMVNDSNWTWSGIFAALATTFAWSVVWDKLWFILNPYYSRGGHTKDTTWWFGRERWIFGLVPESYVGGWGMSLVLAAISGALGGGALTALGFQAQRLGWFLVFMIFAYFVLEPLFRAYYIHMRKHDDRKHVDFYFPQGKRALDAIQPNSNTTYEGSAR